MNANQDAHPTVLPTASCKLRALRATVLFKSKRTAMQQADWVFENQTLQRFPRSKVPVVSVRRPQLQSAIGR